MTNVAKDDRLMRRACLEDVRDALDALGEALATHEHTWSARERKLYDQGIKTLNRELGYLREA